MRLPLRGNQFFSPPPNLGGINFFLPPTLWGRIEVGASSFIPSPSLLPSPIKGEGEIFHASPHGYPLKIRWYWYIISLYYSNITLRGGDVVSFREGNDELEAGGYFVGK